MLCPNCGKENPDDSYYCRGCGFSLKENAPSTNPAGSESSESHKKTSTAPCEIKSKKTALILCLFLGFLGAHRFYVGKYGTGILYLLTLGFFSLGWFFDLFSMICGTFRDKKGFPLL